MKDSPKPLPVREVSGIVKDSTDNEIPYASVLLTSDKDSLRTTTNEDGVFIFKSVKSATYTLLIQSIGYRAIPMRFKQNDAIPRIVMDPIILKDDKNQIQEVVINGTPSITYKTDTVEYKASDYVVRANSTVDELLKKMENMEVGKDGSLTHQGQAVTKAKLNGKDYLGGDIATAIKNLPSEIVEKIQVVDDYGEQATRTGIKDGDPQKVLNITTKTSKSVGNTANMNAGAGNNGRFESGLFATRINGNQTIGINARLNNTVNGSGGGSGVSIGGGGVTIIRGGQELQSMLTNTGGGGGSGGTSGLGSGSVSFRDNLTRNLQVNLSYSFSRSDVNSLNSSISQNFSVLGTTYSTSGNVSDNNSSNHNLRAELEGNITPNNYFRFAPSLTINSSKNLRLDSLFQTGVIHQDRIGTNTSANDRPQLGITLFYQHLFQNKRRNFSLNTEINSNDQKSENEQDARILYYLDATQTILKDSLINRIVARKNLQNTYRFNSTYVEPLTAGTQLELTAQLNYNGYDNSATTQNMNAAGNSQIIDSLSNIYNYSFTQARIGFNYRYGIKSDAKVRFSLGVTAIPSTLSGTKASLGTATNRNSFNLIPIARFEYAFSRQHKASVNYSGNANEPTFDQIQPVRDVSNPQNPVVGNPDLNAAFTHSININYNNYISRSKLNYSVYFSSGFTKDAVVRNNVLISDSYNSLKTETRFVNLNGVHRMSGNYSISKQFKDKKYSLEAGGSVNYSHGLSMSNNIRNESDSWTFSERIGQKINPREWLEINPNISYSYNKSTNTLPTSINSRTNTYALNLDGRFYLWDTNIIGYTLSKNFVSGINANLTNNPFIINLFAEKELFKKRGKITLQAFDLLNQNNYVNRNISDDSIVDTKSNSLSRYFMLRLSMRLQKWTGPQPRNGNMQNRRNDGSFIMN